jgi:hypothetical protein
MLRVTIVAIHLTTLALIGMQLTVIQTMAFPPAYLCLYAWKSGDLLFVGRRRRRVVATMTGSCHHGVGIQEAREQGASNLLELLLGLGSFMLLGRPIGGLLLLLLLVRPGSGSSGSGNVSSLGFLAKDSFDGQVSLATRVVTNHTSHLGAKPTESQARMMASSALRASSKPLQERNRKATQTGQIKVADQNCQCVIENELT